MKQLKTPNVHTGAAREGRARAGYCASAFFATASTIPAVVSSALPDDEFCTLDDMTKAMRRVQAQLLAMNPTPGKHFVLLKVRDARDLILTLVLADTSVGLDDELDPTPVIAAEHAVLKDTVQAVKKVISAAQRGEISFEKIRSEFDKLPNQALTSSVLSMIQQKVPVVQTLAGPIDLSIGKLAVNQVSSEREHVLLGRVSGGYEEQSGTVTLEVIDLENSDPRLFTLGRRITLWVRQEEHRVNLLLAQLAKVSVRVWLKIPRIPITLTLASKVDIRCDLEHMEVLGSAQSFDQIKLSVVQQLKLEL